jgi:hypothetical protein
MTTSDHHTADTKPNLPPNFETRRKSGEERRHRERVLRRGTVSHKQLAEKLRNCRQGHRCQSEADPVCVGQFRLRLFRSGIPILEARPHWTRASVVGGDLLVR